METQTIVFWALAAIFGIIGMASFSRKRNEKVFGANKNFIGIFGVLVALALISGLMGWTAQYGWDLSPKTLVVTQPSGAGATVSPTGVNLCNTATSTTVTMSAVDSYLTTPTGGNHRYRLNGAPALTAVDGNTITAAPGDKLEVLWMNGSATSGDTGYFSEIGTYTIPCKTQYTPEENGGPVLLSRNGTLTLTYFNDPNGLSVDNSTVNQSINSGDVKNMKASIQGAYQRDYLYGFVAVVEYNKTVIDDVIISNRDTGVELTSDIIPQVYSDLYASGGSSKKGYLVPAVMSNKEYLYTVTIDADDTLSADDKTSDIYITYYPRNYFINDKKGGTYDGPAAEDEYNVVTRTGRVQSIIYVM